MEFVPQELDVFSSNPFQLAVQGTEQHILVPVNAVDGQNSLEFFCMSYPNKLKVLDEIYLSASIQIVKNDGTLYTEKDKEQGHLVNSALLSLFKSCSIYLNNTLVNSINDNFGLQEYIQTTLNYSPSVAASKLSNAGFFKEAIKLKNLTKNSNNIDLMAKLNLMNCDKLLVPNVSLGVKLTFQTPDWYFIEEKGGTSEAPTYTKSKLIIKDLKLYVKHIHVRDPYLLHLETTLAKGFLANYEFKYAQTSVVTLAANQMSCNITNLYNGVRPSLLLMCFAPNGSYVGNRNTDPLIFSHNNLIQFNFTINNERVPINPFQLTYEEGKVSKYSYIFHNLYSSLGLSYENADTLVSKENFLTNNFFIVCDISPFTNALSSLNEALDFVNIGFNATFKTQLTEPLTAILYTLLPRKVEISTNRTVNIVY